MHLLIFLVYHNYLHRTDREEKLWCKKEGRRTSSTHVFCKENCTRYILWYHRWILGIKNSVRYYIITSKIYSKCKIYCIRLVYTCDFCCDFRCDFLLLMNVNEWISSEEGTCTLNIRSSSTRLHASEGENRARNHSKNCKCKQYR